MASPLIVGLMGDSGVGKRSLALAITKQTAPSADFTELEGEGVKFVLISNTDPSGKFAIQRADILLIAFAFDSPRSFSSCEKKWALELKLVKKPAILVGTKSDKKAPSRGGPPITIDGPALQKQLKTLAFIACSTQTKEGIEQLVKETVAAGMKVKKLPKNVSGKGGVFGPLFRKTNALYPDAKEGVEINNDTDAAELQYVCFPLNQIKEKWLFNVNDYLKPQKDRGPSSALHGALCCLKDLYYMEGKSWAEKKDKINIGLIKATSDCGNSSVSMGLAWIYFKSNSEAKALALINCGTGGVRFQLYVKKSGVVSCLLEFKPPGGGKGVFTNLRCGSYVPKQEQSAEKIAEEIKQGLASAPWNNEKLREKLAKMGFKADMKIPVFAYITGTIRNHWESKLEDAKEAEAIEKAVGGILDSVLQGHDAHFTKILGKGKPGYLIKQRLEGQMELTGLRGLYAQYNVATANKLKLEPIISLGIGKGSSQWTSVDPTDPNDYTKYILEPEIKYGMDADDLGERLASVIVKEYQSRGVDRLAAMVDCVQKGYTPVIALKSGCLLSLDDASKAKDGKERRKRLVEVQEAGNMNVRPKTVIFKRKDGEATQGSLGTSSVAIACAQACKALMRPGEDPIPQFLRVQIEGQEGCLTSEQLKDVQPGTVLLFLTAADLTGKTQTTTPLSDGKAAPPPQAARKEKVIVEGPLKRKDSNGKWIEKYFVLTGSEISWSDSREKPVPTNSIPVANILSCGPVSGAPCQFELKTAEGGEEIVLESPDDKTSQKWLRRLSRILARLAGKNADPDTEEEPPQKKVPPPPPRKEAPTRAAPKAVVAPEIEPPRESQQVIQNQELAIAMVGDLGLDDPEIEEAEVEQEDSEEEMPAPVPSNNAALKNPSELAEVLKSLGLSEYVDRLSQEEYQLSDLPCLSEAELAQMIPPEAARTKLLQHLAATGIATPTRVGPWSPSKETREQVEKLKKQMALRWADFQSRHASFTS